MTKIRNLLLVSLLIFSFNEKSVAGIAPEDLQTLRTYEDTLSDLSDSIVDGSEQGIRVQACYDFIRTLVKALKVKNSFEYPFDSVKHINIMYPEDRSFRIFNWNVLKTTGVYRYYGAIQKKSSQLKIWPLYDYSDYMKNPQDTITSSEKWFGMLYYQIKQEGKQYLLFGWDGNTLLSNKKIIDVLSFDKKGIPVFGSKIFNTGTMEAPHYLARFIIEYKENAQVSMRFDNDLQMIIYDHLIPIAPKAEGMYSYYVPDGSYEAFELKKKKWTHVQSVFNSTQDQPPFPEPIDFDKKEKENNK
ncbi:hypothetical protein LBMAG27_20320 [Bacteroidota bacterium]|nr:hypothetical protein LBMAG27_20320 [Bacteroidota bacterium]